MAALGVKIGYDEVNAATLTTDHAVEGTRPDLRVGGEREGSTADLEVEVGELGVLSRSDLQKTSGLIDNSTSKALVGCEGIRSQQDKCCSGVNDSSGGGKDDCATVGDGLGDTPKLTGRAGAGDLSVGDRARIAVRVTGMEMRWQLKSTDDTG